MATLPKHLFTVVTPPAVGFCGVGGVVRHRLPGADGADRAVAGAAPRRGRIERQAVPCGSEFRELVFDLARAEAERVVGTCREFPVAGEDRAARLTCLGEDPVVGWARCRVVDAVKHVRGVVPAHPEVCRQFPEHRIEQELVGHLSGETTGGDRQNGC